MKIGILGGSFDPAHKGHLAISKEAKRRFKLEKIIWAVTKKNPLKAESKTPISKKIKDCKKIIGLNSFIKVKFYENIIKSNKTIDLINYLKKDKKIEIFFLMGADNLINFHKWQNAHRIFNEIPIVVFRRYGYNEKALKSNIANFYKNFKINSKNIRANHLNHTPAWTIIQNKEIKISSTEIRKQREQLRSKD